MFSFFTRFNTQLKFGTEESCNDVTNQQG